MARDPPVHSKVSHFKYTLIVTNSPNVRIIPSCLTLTQEVKVCLYFPSEGQNRFLQIVVLIGEIDHICVLAHLNHAKCVTSYRLDARVQYLPPGHLDMQTAGIEPSALLTSGTNALLHELQTPTHFSQTIIFRNSGGEGIQNQQ